MSSANLGWLFYKDYFNGLDYHDLKNPQNEEILESKIKKLIKASTITKQETLGNITFEATTTYPGLLLGSGTTHELPEIKSQAILGFHFDYTTGLPVITGSSIKGVLRSAFKYPEYIQSLLDDNSTDIKKLELEIFGQENGSSEVTQGTDIFFDAFIISAGAGGKIIDEDYITPHKNRKKVKDENGAVLPDELFDPIPLRFIKVIGGVKFKFDFLLSDGAISKEDKATLFTKILVDLGVGAKTNVGYGKLDIKTSFIPDEDPLEKIFIEYNGNLANLVAAYNQGLKERVSSFKEEFKSKLIELLQKELEQEKKRQKREKIEKRIEKVRSF